MPKDLITIINEVKNSLFSFMDHQMGKAQKGYYSYSYSGDYYTERTHWNLGASIFALKIYWILGIRDANRIKPTIDYIRSFQTKNGMIYDPLINRKGFLRNLQYSIRSRQYQNLLNKNYKIADTRQSYSALDLFNALPKTIWWDIPSSIPEIDCYLSGLNWSTPWGAGANFSHLLFFLSLAEKKGYLVKTDYERLTDFIIQWITKLCHSGDGGWYKGKADLQQIINGSMKIITGFLRINQLAIPYPEKLVDTCLTAGEQRHACDQFNTMMTLCYCNQMLDNTYKYEQIKQYAMIKMKDYLEHYHSASGGFSFYKGKANDIYYNARITKGLNEPDIHGTLMFLWGITMVAKILKIEKELNIYELIS